MNELLSLLSGSHNSPWGPCSDGSKDKCDCIQCETANNVEKQGLDFNEEYEKARLRNFDKPDYSEY